MEKYIIIILVIILIIYLLNKNNNEENLTLTLSEEELNKLNNVVDLYHDVNNTKYADIPNIEITGDFNIGEENINQYVINYKYPVGCYYIQYPDSNINMSRIGDELITPFPEEKSPAKLFGGEWIEVWGGESIYFRTGKEGTNAYEGESRKDGLQNYALKRMTGTTSWGQTNISMYDYEKIGQGYSGVFTLVERKTIRADKGSKYIMETNYSNTLSHRNNFDTITLLPNNTSEDEIRVKNKLIKIWKRIR